MPGSQLVTAKLKSNNNWLAIATSRPESTDLITIAAADAHFHGVFSDIYYTDEWDKSNDGLSKPDVVKITDHLKNSPKKKVIVNIDELLIVVKTQNLKDSLKGVFSIKDEIFKRSIENCILTFEKVKAELL